MGSPYHEMFHARPASAFTAGLIAWIALATAADDAAIKAVRMARAKRKLSQIAPYHKALADLTAAANAVQIEGVTDNDRTPPQDRCRLGA